MVHPGLGVLEAGVVVLDRPREGDERLHIHLVFGAQLDVGQHRFASVVPAAHIRIKITLERFGNFLCPRACDFVEGI